MVQTPTDWIEWKGGECPLQLGERVTLRYREESAPGKRDAETGYVYPPYQAGMLSDCWGPHRGNKHDIIAYRVVRS